MECVIFKFKKITKAGVFLVIAGLFCSCAKTDILPQNTAGNGNAITNPFVDTPESNASGVIEEPPINVSYGFTYGGYVKNGDTEYSPSPDIKNEYSGGEITYYIRRNSKGNASEAEEGYLIFLDGIPQQITYVGDDGKTEVGEFIIISQPPDVEKEIILAITPKITEAMMDKDELVLRMVAVTGKSKQDNDAVFPDNRICVPMNDFKIKPTVPLEISENPPSVMAVECEQIAITPTETFKYNIQENLWSCVMLNTVGGSWQSMFILPENTSTITADCIMYAQTDYSGKYRIFFYRNNKPIKLTDGSDCIEMEVKNGFLTKCEVTLENLKNRDEIFAIATPLDKAVRDSAPMSEIRLVLSEADPYYVSYKNTWG